MNPALGPCASGCVRPHCDPSSHYPSSSHRPPPSLILAVAPATSSGLWPRQPRRVSLVPGRRGRQRWQSCCPRSLSRCWTTPPRCVHPICHVGCSCTAPLGISLNRYVPRVRRLLMSVQYSVCFRMLRIYPPCKLGPIGDVRDHRGPLSVSNLTDPPWALLGIIRSPRDEASLQQRIQLVST
ncbi:uncharacterized protein C8Q71DRAFT_512159 [Rhodofomes roseus]|uniref:Uncharacterized protein n=1 Tax=Rhodofomes roseus TaxID=34475 RepID=A0ABQ8KMW1_9APHY|nr:uncharacterized protein C8Q71DRAFT_512159 [Rhodofomes roseus]KAH9839438.1 hypothetical protein C8Q71DRAFT_512159 [Rhodofomes roseus]